MSDVNKILDFENMSDEELKKFREQFNPDEMGFDGEEGVNEEGENDASN